MKIGTNTCIENYSVHNKAIDLMYDKVSSTSLPV